MLEVHDSRMRM